jgi:hypothetical protein
MCDTIERFRADPSMSIPRISQALAKYGVLQIKTGPDSDLNARHCILSVARWCSLLFIPSQSITDEAFDLDSQGANCFTRSSVLLTIADRWIDETLRSFGEPLLKRRSEL